MCTTGNTYVYDQNKQGSYLSNTESFQIIKKTSSCPFSSWSSCYIIKPNSVTLKNRHAYYTGISGYGSNYGYTYTGCVKISGQSCNCKAGS